jgi:hypothetical protein
MAARRNTPQADHGSRYRFGLGTTSHEVPFQRSITVSIEAPVR